MGTQLRALAGRHTVGPTRPVSERPGLRLRPMEAEDLEEVLAIEERSFTAPWTRGAFERLLRRPTAGALVAVEGESVVGYAVFWTVDGECELGNLAVRPDARRRGLGRRLVRAACGAARRAGARTLYLEVRESNEAARSLYRELDFRNVTRRPGYYRSPSEDALVLERELRDPVPSAPPATEER